MTSSILEEETVNSPKENTQAEPGGKNGESAPDKGFGVDLSDASLLFYDIECFKYNSLIVFKDIQNREVAHFWCSNSEKFDKDAIIETIRDKTLVGFNNYYYDDKMLKLILRGANQKTLKNANDKLISGAKVYVNTNDDEDITTIDCMQQIDVSRPSLKRIEGNMGKSIIESSVDFNIDRELTEDEKQEVLEYCRYDVENTIEIFKLRRKQYFDVKNQLLEMLEDKKATKWNTTSISGALLLDKMLIPWNRLELLNKKEQGSKIVPEEVWAEWSRAEKAYSQEQGDSKPKTITIDSMGCTFVFGGGGLHGVAKEGREFYDVKLLDVGSMYPSIIINLQALGKATTLYDQIRKDRLAIKHVDKLKSNALKLILNSVYGNLKNQYSILHNPMASLSVCVYGQMALYDLCKDLDAAGWQVINANTDGVAFVKREENPGDWEPIQKAWESRWNLNLELDEFDWWIQKDVNNYIATRGDHVKVKGGETKKYPFDPQKGIHSFFSNNDCRIVHICIVEYILAYHRGETPSLIDMVVDRLDQPILFQYILRAGHTYKGVVDKDGNQMQKVNRVFGVREGVPSTKLYKLRQDDGLVNFPDTPDRMLVWNDDVDNIHDFDQIVDINHYLGIIKKKLSGWGFQM